MASPSDRLVLLVLACMACTQLPTGFAVGRGLGAGALNAADRAPHIGTSSAAHALWDAATGFLHRLMPWWGPTSSDGADDGGKSDFSDVDAPGVVRAHWALLIAGSNGWWNYRHQADVAHAYQVLRAGGFRPEHTVVMMYDDLVADPNNPYPGKLFNRPGGPDVYHGLRIDYRKEHVNAETFLAVLAGNRTAVQGKGSGKVIASGPNDRVFIFYSDHGSPGILGMPTGDFLYADQFIATITAKREARGFREMVIYIEACESGSMFEGLLRPDLGVYVTTASNALESSWGTYCPGMDTPPAAGFDTCLGDLYSVAWMEDAECEDGRLETLQEQFEAVRARTSNNYTYNMGSHVMQYGAVDQQGPEHTGSYEGVRTAGSCVRPSPSSQRNQALLLGSPAGTREALQATTTVPQREADLVPLRARVARAKTPEEREAAQAALDAALSTRRAVDTGLEAAATVLLAKHAQRMPQRVLLGLQDTSGSAAWPSGAATRITSQVLPDWEPGSGRPVVDSFDCLRGLVGAYTRACGPMDQYTMRHTRLFANLCNAGLGSPDALEEALHEARGCASLATSAAIA